MKIGYAPVSTEEHNLDLQHHVLKAAGYEVIYGENKFPARQGRRRGREEPWGA